MSAEHPIDLTGDESYERRYVGREDYFDVSYNTVLTPDLIVSFRISNVQNRQLFTSLLTQSLADANINVANLIVIDENEEIQFADLWNDLICNETV
jgi:hypothetical protein